MLAPRKLIKLPQVTEITTLKRSTVYERVKAGTFPAPLKVGARGSAWDSDEISTWLDKLPRAGLRASQ